MENKKHCCSDSEKHLGMAVNEDVLAGKWKQVRGKAKEWWGELTDDDLDRVGGKSEQLVGLLQEKYGYTRERAQQEFDRRMAETND